MWVTRSNLARLTGLTDIRVDQLRKQFGNPFEHGKGQALRIYAPAWLQRFNKERSAQDSDEERIRRERRDRMEEIKLLNDELDLGERQKRLVDVDKFMRERFGPCLDEIRTGIEAIHIWPEAQKTILDQLNVALERLQANGISIDIDGDGSTGRKGRGKANPKNTKKPSRVRKNIRQDASGGAKGRSKVS